MSRLRTVALLPSYSVKHVTNSKQGKRIMAERDQLSYAFSYSYLVPFFIVFEVVTRDWNNLYHLRVPLSVLFKVSLSVKFLCSYCNKFYFNFNKNEN